MSAEIPQRHVIDGAALVASLREFVRIPSTPGRPNSLREAAAWVESSLQGAGFRVWRHGPSNAPTILGECPGSTDRWLLFYSHYDVTEPGDASAWRVDPFSGEVLDGRLYGRGASDHKASFIARLYGVLHLLDKGPLPIGIRFMVEGEEESGSPNLEALLRDFGHEIAAEGGIYSGGALDEEERPVIRAGSKGMCSLRLTVRTVHEPMHSKWAAIVPNPAWRLMQALTSMVDARTGRVLVDSFYDDVVPIGDSEREAASALSFGADAFRRVTGLRQFVGDGTDQDILERLMFSPTFNVAWFSAGTGGRTVLPDEASAILDVRLVPWQRTGTTEQRIRHHLHRHGFDDVEVVALGGGDPDRCELSDPVVTSLEAACRSVYDTPPQVHPSGAGSGPRYLFRRYLGISLVQDPGASWFASNDHGPNENVRINDVLNNARLVEAFLNAYGQTTRS